jgi:hypothetical protein
VKFIRGRSREQNDLIRDEMLGEENSSRIKETEMISHKNIF